MLEPRNFGVWVWWFHFPVRLQDNHFSKPVRQTGLQKDDCPWKWGSSRRHKLGFGGYIQVHRRAGIPLVLSSYIDHNCSAIFEHCWKFGLLSTIGFLGNECGTLWHLGTGVTHVTFVTWSSRHIWTVDCKIGFVFIYFLFSFYTDSTLHNYFV